MIVILALVAATDFQLLGQQVLHEVVDTVLIHVEVILCHVLHAVVAEILQVLQHQLLQTKRLLALLSGIETHFLLEEEVEG
jgi:hypothetical protein